MRTLLLGLALAAVTGIIGGAAAQDFPSRPITMVVPFPAGGPNDTIGRIVTERMCASLGFTRPRIAREDGRKTPPLCSDPPYELRGTAVCVAQTPQRPANRPPV